MVLSEYYFDPRIALVNVYALLQIACEGLAQSKY